MGWSMDLGMKKKKKKKTYMANQIVRMGASKLFWRINMNGNN
jgi:hypothetical protein